MYSNPAEKANFKSTLIEYFETKNEPRLISLIKEAKIEFVEIESPYNDDLYFHLLIQISARTYAAHEDGLDDCRQKIQDVVREISDFIAQVSIKIYLSGNAALYSAATQALEKINHQ